MYQQLNSQIEPITHNHTTTYLHTGQVSPPSPVARLKKNLLKKFISIVYNTSYQNGLGLLDTGVYPGVHYFLIFALKHRLWADSGDRDMPAPRGDGMLRTVGIGTCQLRSCCDHPCMPYSKTSIKNHIN